MERLALLAAGPLPLTVAAVWTIALSALVALALDLRRLVTRPERTLRVAERRRRAARGLRAVRLLFLLAALRDLLLLAGLRLEEGLDLRLVEALAERLLERLVLLDLDLRAAERLLERRLLARLFLAGAALLDPERERDLD